jgi:cell division protein FtsN
LGSAHPKRCERIAPKAMERRTSSRRTSRPVRRNDAGGTLFGIFIGLVVGLGLAAGVAFWLMRNNPAIPSPIAGKDSHEPAREAARGRGSASADKPRFDFYKILPGVEEPKVTVERRLPDQADRALAEQARSVPIPAPKGAGAPASAAPASAAPTSAGPTAAAPTAAAPTAAAPTAAAPPSAAVPAAAAPSVSASTAAGSERLAYAEPPSRALKAGERYWLQVGSFSTQSDAENLKARLALAGWEANVQTGNVPDKGLRYRVRLGPYGDADEIARMKSELGRRGFDVAVIKY